MLRNLGYLEEERNEQIRKENERRFQQEQQRINNQRLHEINERNRIALEREMRGEEQRKKEKRNKSEKKPVAQTQMFLRRNRRIIVGQ